MAASFFAGTPEPAAFVPAYRAIGPTATPTGDNAATQTIPVIFADVTIEEEHRDELVITEHPVEQGAAISDHAFKRPSEVVIRAGWSASSGNATSATYATDIRAQLLALQASRLPFDLFTGKQAYSQMLLAVLSTHTDESSEYSLLATLVCRQVILVSTKTTSVPATATNPQVRPTSEQGTQSIYPALGWNPSTLQIQDPKTGNALLSPTTAFAAGVR